MKTNKKVKAKAKPSNDGYANYGKVKPKGPKAKPKKK